ARESMCHVDSRSFEAVLGPKIKGTLTLDEALETEDPDFVCYFSSSSAILGDFGAGSYAIGNRFQAAYASHADGRIRARGGHARVLAIEWPLWAEGGMGLADERATRIYLHSTGQQALREKQGCETFEQLLAEPPAQQLVMVGAPARVHRILGFLPKPAPVSGADQPSETSGKRSDSAAIPATEDSPDTGSFESQTIAFLKRVFAAALGLPAARLEAGAKLEKYGVDSIAATHVTAELEKTFGSLPKTLMFEYQSIDALAHYFTESHRDALASALMMGSRASAARRAAIGGGVAAVATSSADKTRHRSRLTHLASDAPRHSQRLNGPSDIAIIGLSCHYPQSRDVRQFWENLKEGRDCISKIPPTRWDHHSKSSSHGEKAGERVIDWGGFLPDFDSFDHRFFGIKDDELPSVDCQEKLFLEAVWHLLEHAGYTPHLIQARHRGNVGVYVGASAFVQSGFSTGMLAGRIGGFLGLNGPTLVVDSYSASATTALHLACQALAAEDCEAAIVGGVHVLSPELFYSFGRWQQGMEPDCRGFSSGGGAVLSEGVGAVLLKPLAAAVRDEDTIWAVIKATALSGAGDMANVPPEPARLAGVINKSLARADVHPRSIGYVEPMVMGIPAVDYCEFIAFTRVFREQTTDRGFCAMGTVESNIGHSIAACGMAQLIKVVLQMRHRHLVPTIKADPVNAQLEFSDSPFYLQRTLSEWREDRNGSNRKALYTSRGRSGTLAAVVLEEFSSEPHARARRNEPDGDRRLFLVSAHTPAHLRQVVRGLRDHVREHPHEDLRDLSHTLIMRREPMRFRLAAWVRTAEELISRLEEYLDADIAATMRGTSEGLCVGDAESTASGIQGLLDASEESRLLEAYLGERNLQKLAAFWVRGSDIRAVDGADQAFSGRLMQLPAYPFRTH
ncbi:MAG: beta-ketoacyl synthase N-terminal-like domain-containing protein, partial [Steroidobacteraceae bacterium]